MLKRELQKELELNILKPGNRNVAIIEGARQTGKTTLIKQILSKVENVVSVNFETERLLNSRVEATEGFQQFIEILENEKGLNKTSTKYVFIDEAQENDCIGGYVREMKESEYQIKWILSGSSMTRLFKKKHRVPVGRFERYKVSPFTFIDFLQAANKDNLIEVLNTYSVGAHISDYLHQELLNYVDQYLQVGGLPEVVLSYFNKEDHRNTLEQLFVSQEDDFISKTGLEKKYLYRQALEAVANQLGSQSHFSQIDDKIRDAKSIVGMLERWNLINTLVLKGMNTTTRFHPKRYLYDIGIAQLIRKHPFPKISLINSLDPALRTPLGGLFENLVYITLQGSSSSDLSLSGWKKNSKEQVEVDFIWRSDHGVIPIECKASTKINTSLYGLLAYLNASKQKFGVLVSAAKFSVIKEGSANIVNIPIYLASKNIIAACAERYQK